MPKKQRAERDGKYITRPLDELEKITKDWQPVTIAEAGLLLRASPDTVRRMLASGELQATIFGTPQKITFGAVRRYLETKDAPCLPDESLTPTSNRPANAPQRGAARGGKTKAGGTSSASRTTEPESPWRRLIPKGPKLF